MLVGVYQAGNRLDTLVLHDISLVVTERITATSRSAESILHQWILLDEDADGVLDKAIFIERTEQTAGSQKGVDILSDQRVGLQSYFEQTIRNLNKKAMESSADACIPS